MDLFDKSVLRCYDGNSFIPVDTTARYMAVGEVGMASHFMAHYKNSERSVFRKNRNETTDLKIL